MRQLGVGAALAGLLLWNPAAAWAQAAEPVQHAGYGTGYVSPTDSVVSTGSEAVRHAGYGTGYEAPTAVTATEDRAEQALEEA